MLERYQLSAKKKTEISLRTIKHESIKTDYLGEIHDSENIQSSINKGTTRDANTSFPKEEITLHITKKLSSIVHLANHQGYKRISYTSK